MYDAGYDLRPALAPRVRCRSRCERGRDPQGDLGGKDRALAVGLNRSGAGRRKLVSPWPAERDRRNAGRCAIGAAKRLAVTMNIGPLMLTNSGPPPVSLTC